MEDKKNNILALVTTLVVHLAILLILLFCTMDMPVIPDNDGEGVVLQLGMVDADAGTFTPAPTPPPVPQSQPEPAPVITQDIEETVSIDEEKPVEEQQPEPETTQLDNLWTSAVNKGQNASDTIGSSAVKKGSPTATSTIGAVSGSPGYGEYDLGGRGLVGYLPRPDYSGTNDEGIIVIEITVDAQGNVISAGAKLDGSTGSVYTNKTLRERAESAARKAKFAVKSDGKENQTGTITYRFNQK